VRAKVREHRLAQRQARQAKGKRENRYVIKVMRLNVELSFVLYENATKCSLLVHVCEVE
jgi:hypothetical protein